VPGGADHGSRADQTSSPMRVEPWLKMIAPVLMPT
jgi:hypothetical protein